MTAAAMPELTRNQALVLSALSAAEGPLSAYTILDRLRADGLRAPLQVYRALERLQDYGLVHRLETLNAFVACAHPHDHDHHADVIAFAICETCGQVTEFADETVTARLDEWGRNNGFHSRKAVIELRGTCNACAQA